MIECAGWWEQFGMGRQPMTDLVMEFHGRAITGAGCDVIEKFTLSGNIRQDGSVELMKQYNHRHSVLYVGVYDGEGTFNGRWDIGGYQGEWSIRLLKPRHSSTEEDIQEIGN